MRDWLAAAAERHPDKIALLHPHHDLPELVGVSYEQLNLLAAAEAGGLKRLGVERGDRVGVLMDNSQRYVSLIWGIGRVGATLVPLNTRLTPDELRYQVDKTRCKIVICSSLYQTVVLALQSDSCPVYTDGSMESENALRFPDDISDDEIKTHLDGDLDPEATAAIIFTSGTTGKPKGAQLTFGNFYYSALASADRIGVKEDDRWLLALPLYHVGGLSILFRAALDGTSFTIPDTPPGTTPNIRTIAETIDGERITLVSLVPTQLYRILEGSFTFPPHLRMILLGGAAASSELLRRSAELHLPVATTYGLTEAASQVATMLPDDVRRKLGSVGKPLTGTTVQIFGENEQPLPTGEYGEIVVTGRTVMKGYLDEAGGLRDGNLYTGDIGYLDDEGDLWLVQRRSDLIVSGGENIYPAEVEAVLRQHPGIAEAAVVGVSSAEWGQRVAAAVVPKQGTNLNLEDIDTFARAHLAGYKRPRLFRIVEALPQTASGKVQRSAVKALFEGQQ